MSGWEYVVTGVWLYLALLYIHAVWGVRSIFLYSKSFMLS